MRIFKQDNVMNEIIYAITSGEKVSGDLLRSKDYDIAPAQMGQIFKTLSDNDIVYRTNNNSYALSSDCVSNAQELYFQKIAECISRIKLLAQTANIPVSTLIEIIKSELMK